MAQSIREGWTRDNFLNLNTADGQQLQKLQWIDEALANRIVAHHPYRQPSELVTGKCSSSRCTTASPNG
jgi:hypothetical protein